MRKSIVYVLFLVSLSGYAQQNGYFSLSQYQMNMVNPAHAGVEADKLFSIVSRNQWASIDDGPKTLAMSYSEARNNNVGLGISVISDQIFIEKQTLVTVDFSYKLKMYNEALLYLGLKGGMNSFQANTIPLTSYSNQSDPAQKDLSRLTPNIGVGLYYTHNNFWLSAALPRLFNAKRDEEIALQAQDRVHTYINIGRKIPLPANLAVTPELIYRKASGIDPVVEGIIWGNYQEKVHLGVGFRTASVVSLKFNVALNEMFSFAYSYDTYGSERFSGLQLNAHELGLTIRLKSKAGIEEQIKNETSEEDKAIE